MELLDLFLESLGLVEDIIMGEHHEDEDKTTIYFLHRFVINEIEY